MKPGWGWVGFGGGMVVLRADKARKEDANIKM
jgi:hypothetical protein